MPAGRPTDYRPCYAAQLIEYFESHEPFRECVVAEGTHKEKIQLVPNKFPTITRFAANLGFCQETLRIWATATNDKGEFKHPEFAEAYKRAKEIQCSILIEGAMTGAYNPQFSQFVAINLFG